MSLFIYFYVNRLSIFLHHLNGFYDTYLSTGARYRVKLADATRGDLMLRLARTAVADHEVTWHWICCCC